MAMQTKITIAAAIKRAAAILEKAGIEEGRREAGILMEYVLSISREKLLAMLQEEMPSASLDSYFHLVEIRSKRYPLQYITGKQEFMGFPFKVTPAVLIPRRETEELVQRVLDSDISRGARIVDAGTGSGAIAISIAKLRPNLEVFATDSSEKALEVARENAAKLGAKVEFFKGDMLIPLKAKNIKIQAVISNPPYVKHEELKGLMPEVKHEPPEALDGGDDGLYFYRKISRQCDNVLLPGGRIFLEIGADQSLEIKEILTSAGFSEIEVSRDLQGRDRIVSAIYRKEK